LWPIAATGIVPVCFKVMVKLVHEAGTVMEPTLNCIASLPSISVLQSLTTAAGLSLAAGGVAAGVATGAVSIGGGVSVAGAGAGVVAVSDGGCWPPQAARPIRQAAVSRAVRECAFIVDLRLESGCMIGLLALARA
jgi:hypothetical protein